MADKFLDLDIYRPVRWRSAQRVLTRDTANLDIDRVYSRNQRWEIIFTAFGSLDQVSAAFIQYAAVWGGPSGIFTIDKPQMVEWTGTARHAVQKADQYAETVRFATRPGSHAPAGRYVRFSNHSKAYGVRASSEEALTIWPPLFEALPSGTEVLMSDDLVDFRGIATDEYPAVGAPAGSEWTTMTVTLREKL